jgi:hypothetical protein
MLLFRDEKRVNGSCTAKLIDYCKLCKDYPLLLDCSASYIEDCVIVNENAKITLPQHKLRCIEILNKLYNYKKTIINKINKSIKEIEYCIEECDINMKIFLSIEKYEKYDRSFENIINNLLFSQIRQTRIFIPNHMDISVSFEYDTDLEKINNSNLTFLIKPKYYKINVISTKLYWSLKDGWIKHRTIDTDILFPAWSLE